MKSLCYTILFLFGLNAASFSQKLGNALAREITTDAKGNSWILGTDFGIYQFQQNTWTEHLSHTKSRKISVSSNGKLYTVGYDNKMYVAKNAKEWATITPKQTVKCLVADAKEQLYIIGFDDKIYKQIGQIWKEVAPNGKAKQLIVSPQGRLYHIGFNKKVYVLESNNWQEMPCPKAKQIAQDAFGKVWIIGLDDKIYYPAGRSLNWVVYPEAHKAKALAMSPEGLPIYVDYWSNAVVKGKVVVR